MICIDLVARTRFGEYWAIQCKSYGENTSIDMAQVALFISNSGRSFVDPVTGETTQFATRYAQNEVPKKGASRCR